MRKTTLPLVILALTLAACAGQEKTGDTSPAAAVGVDAWKGELPIAAPWLREQLPPGALAYQRIPNPLALMAIPKGNVLDAALGSEANIRNLLDLQLGLSENVADDSPLFADPGLLLLADHLRSPIELVAIGFPQVSAIAGMTLDLRSNADLEALISELSRNQSVPGLMAPLDAQGFARLAAPLPVFVHFDEQSGRLALYGGPTATRAAFSALLEPPPEDVVRAMQPLEAQIDESGQGLFGWIDATQALGIGAMFMPPDAMQALRETGLDQLRAVAVGAGVANGKGRLKLVADVGTDRATRLLPLVGNRISATSAGEPRSLFLLSLPGPDELARLETLLLSRQPPESREHWTRVKSALAEASGVTIEELLAAVGPELIAITDDAGRYSGIRIRNADLLDDVLNRLAAGAGVTIEERRVDGQRIRYVSLPGSRGMPDEADVPPPVAALLGSVGRLRSRFFWVEEGDYLYVAGAPQVLMERAARGADTSVARWLSDRQRVDLSSALAAGTGTVGNLPRTMYQAYLGMMQAMADIANADYDVWSMPTATQLGLPDRGTLGLSLNLGEPYVSLELTYESNPSELLLAGTGGPGALAAAGAIAAVALPALRSRAAD